MRMRYLPGGSSRLSSLVCPRPAPGPTCRGCRTAGAAARRASPRATTARRPARRSSGRRSSRRAPPARASTASPVSVKPTMLSVTLSPEALISAAAAFASPLQLSSPSVIRITEPPPAAFRSPTVCSTERMSGVSPRGRSCDAAFRMRSRSSFAIGTSELGVLAGLRGLRRIAMAVDAQADVEIVRQRARRHP